MKELKTLKPLNWNNSCFGLDDVLRGMESKESISIYENRTMDILYSIQRMDYNAREMRELDKPEYRVLILIDMQNFSMKCSNFEDGKEICEKWRNWFWNDLLREMKEKIFKEE